MEIGTASTSFSAINPGNMDKMHEKIQEKLQTKIDSGEISSEQLQSKLQERFGDSVNAAFAEDGTIDYDKLGETIQTAMKEKMSSMMPAAMSQLNGGQAEGFDSFSTLMEMLSQYDDEQDNENSSGTLLNLSA